MTTSSSNNSAIHHQQLLFQHHHQEQEHEHDATPYQPSSASPMMMRRQLPSSSPSSSSFSQNLIGNREHRIEDDVEQGQAFYMYLHDQQPQYHHRDSAPNFQTQIGIRPPTLNIFPSLPMHEDQASPGLKVNSNNLGFARGGGSYGSNTNLFADGPSSVVVGGPNNQINCDQLLPPKPLKHGENRQHLQQPKGQTSSSEQEGRQAKILDPKTLRRLAQNREAARKSRIRKKAYIQQLESSRMKLVQLEQELHRSRSTQGATFTGGYAGDQSNQPMGLSLSSDAVVFDMEYGRWLEEQHKLTCELRAAYMEQLHENELRLFVDKWLAHFDQLIHLKSMVAKADSFHLLSGSWKSPAERCFMWIGGFRPSQLIKVIMKQIEELSDNQLMAIYGLQNSAQEGEEALSNGLETLSQSISNIITSGSLTSPPTDMNNYMSQMAVAINKLSSLEGFVRQADKLRQQTLHRLHQFLSARQAARCFVLISEYFHSLRALSSLWLARPRQECD